MSLVGARAAAASIADKIRTTVAKIEEAMATRDKTPAKKVIKSTSTEIAPTRCTPKSLRTVDSGPTVAETAPVVHRAVAVVTVVAEVAAATRIVVVAAAVAMAVGSTTTSLEAGCALISSREHLLGSRVPQCLKKTFSTPTRRLSSSMRTRWLLSNANVNMCAST